MVQFDKDSNNDHFKAIATQSDGKVVVVGDIGSDYNMTILRYNSDGGLDVTFNDDGIQTFANPGTDIAYDVAIDSEGRFILVGRSDGGAANDQGTIWRFWN